MRFELSTGNGREHFRRHSAGSGAATVWEWLILVGLRWRAAGVRFLTVAALSRHKKISPVI
jgi:hypothetical protein